jgi:hypothetical protein
MPCYPANDLLWVQITQSYPNRLRFSSLPCPQSPCHTVIDPFLRRPQHRFCARKNGEILGNFRKLGTLTRQFITVFHALSKEQTGLLADFVSPSLFFVSVHSNLRNQCVKQQGF